MIGRRTIIRPHINNVDIAMKSGSESEPQKVKFDSLEISSYCIGVVLKSEVKCTFLLIDRVQNIKAHKPFAHEKLGIDP